MAVLHAVGGAGSNLGGVFPCHLPMRPPLATSQRGPLTGQHINPGDAACLRQGVNDLGDCVIAALWRCLEQSAVKASISSRPAMT